jgi:hypothetical protein
MREVRARALLRMKSPIRHVMEHAHDAIINIAPEKREEFKATFSDFTLEYLDDYHWVCKVDVSAKCIWLSSKVVEVLWAASFAYFRLYKELEKRIKGKAGVSVEIELRTDPCLRDATDILHWAFDSWLNKRDVQWPEQLPKPLPEPPHASDEHMAQELSLCAVGLLLHHELAHVRLGHEGKSELEMEREADRAAAEWVLSGLPERDARFVKRALGMAVALAVLVADGIHTNRYGGQTHPRSYDRLMHTFYQHVADPNHHVWWFIAAILKLHLDSEWRDASLPEGPFDSARDCVDAYVDALSRLP